MMKRLELFPQYSYAISFRRRQFEHKRKKRWAIDYYVIRNDKRVAGPFGQRYMAEDYIRLQRELMNEDRPGGACDGGGDNGSDMRIHTDN